MMRDSSWLISAAQRDAFRHTCVASGGSREAREWIEAARWLTSLESEGLWLSCHDAGCRLGLF